MKENRTRVRTRAACCLLPLWPLPSSAKTTTKVWPWTRRPSKILLCIDISITTSSSFANGRIVPLFATLKHGSTWYRLRASVEERDCQSIQTMRKMESLRDWWKETWIDEVVGFCGCGLRNTRGKESGTRETCPQLNFIHQLHYKQLARSLACMKNDVDWYEWTIQRK